MRRYSAKTRQPRVNRPKPCLVRFRYRRNRPPFRPTCFCLVLFRLKQSRNCTNEAAKLLLRKIAAIMVYLAENLREVRLWQFKIKFWKAHKFSLIYEFRSL